MAGALLVCLAALGWGRLLSKRSVALAFGLGLLLLSLGASACLLAGWVRLGFPLLVGGGVLLALPALGDLGPKGRLEAPDWICAAWLGAAAALALLPTRDWDTLVYHFAVPRDHLLRGFARWRLDLPQAALPQGAESLWALGMAFGAERGAALLNVAVLAASAGAAGWAARTVWGAEPGWSRPLALASFSLCGAPGGGAVEPLTGLGILLAVSLGTLALRGAGRVAWVASALAAGAAVGTKPTAVLFLAPFLLTAPRRLLVLAAAALLIGSPWYLRAWHHAGNPFYPFACPFLPDLPREIALCGRPETPFWPAVLGGEAVLFLGAGFSLLRGWGAALLGGALGVLALTLSGRFLGALAPAAAASWRGWRRTAIALSVAGMLLVGARLALRLRPGPEGDLARAARVCRALEPAPGSLALSGERVLAFPPGTIALADYAQAFLNPFGLKDAEDLREALKRRGISLLAVDRSRHGRGLPIAALLPSRSPPPRGFALLYDAPEASVYRVD